MWEDERCRGNWTGSIIRGMTLNLQQALFRIFDSHHFAGSGSITPLMKRDRDTGDTVMNLHPVYKSQQQTSHLELKETKNGSPSGGTRTR
jgi:hypothetical protein